MVKKITLIVFLLLKTTAMFSAPGTLTEKQKEGAFNLGAKLIIDYYRNIEVATVFDSVDFDRKDTLLTRAGSRYFRINNFEAIDYANDFGICLDGGDKVKNYENYKDFLAEDPNLSMISPVIAPEIVGHSNMGYDPKGGFFYYYMAVSVEVKTPNVKKPKKYDKVSNSDLYFYVTFKLDNSDNAEIKFERTLLQSLPNAKQKFDAINESAVKVVPENDVKAENSYVVFKVQPEGARVKIDGKPIFYVNNEQFKTTPGTHKLSIENEGYATKDEVIDCGMSGGIVIEEKLEEKIGILNIRENQDLPDATVLIDDEEIGKLPMHDYKLKVGSYKVTIRKKGYLSRSGAINVRENETTIYTPKKLISKKDAIKAGIITAGGVVAVYEIVHNKNKIATILNSTVKNLPDVINKVKGHSKLAKFFGRIFGKGLKKKMHIK